MEKKSSSGGKGSTSRAVVKGGLVLPPDVIAQDLKKTARKAGNFSGLQRRSDMKAVVEAKGAGDNANTRRLAMVLRSEREHLNANNEQEMEISLLKLLLQEKNNEVEKLKDLCLKQREEIKALKSAKLFPDVMNSQLQALLEKQGSELKQSKQVIPILQKQVTFLTGQIQCLVEDLAEVKAEKYSARRGLQSHGSCARTSTYDHEVAANSLEFEAMSKESTNNGRLSQNRMQMSSEFGLNSHGRNLSKSRDCCQPSNSKPSKQNGSSSWKESLVKANPFVSSSKRSRWC